MNHQIILFTLGILLLTLGVALLAPFWMDLYDVHGNAPAFGWSALLAVFMGGAMCISNYGFRTTLTLRDAFLMTTASWLTVCFFSAIPLYMSDLGISMTDAIFESVSGVTTTGSTVLSGLDQMSRGILLWRAIMQWIGGIGIIAFAMILLPFLSIGGMQLFKSESSDQSEKIMPRTSDIVWSIIYVYAALTICCIALYDILGMSHFDALIHALTTLPTGGFSSHDASFGYFDSYALHMVGSLFMLLGIVPFILYVKFVYKGEFEFFKDEQVRTLLILLGGVISVLTFYLWASDQYSLPESFKFATFNVISVISTTGYATTDYTLWGPFALALFFFITYLGGCAGSTTGGVKMLRINIAIQSLNLYFKKLVYPSGVFSSTYQNKPLGDDIIHAVMGFLFMFVICNVLLTIALALTGLDFLTSITAVATAIANVGPGLGNIIGPAGNFAPLSDTAKWLLCLGMLLGRLEVMTMLVLIAPSFWRD